MKGKPGKGRKAVSLDKCRHQQAVVLMKRPHRCWRMSQTEFCALVTRPKNSSFHVLEFVAVCVNCSAAAAAGPAALPPCRRRRHISSSSTGLSTIRQPWSIQRKDISFQFQIAALACLRVTARSL
jgi:hypothetical protein